MVGAFSECIVYNVNIDIHWNDAEGTWCDVFYNESGSSFVVHKGYISLFPFLMGKKILENF